jgi:hypothetical protein
MDGLPTPAPLWPLLGNEYAQQRLTRPHDLPSSGPTWTKNPLPELPHSPMVTGQGRSLG